MGTSLDRTVHATNTSAGSKAVVVITARPFTVIAFIATRALPVITTLGHSAKEFALGSEGKIYLNFVVLESD